MNNRRIPLNPHTKHPIPNCPTITVLSVSPTMFIHLVHVLPSVSISAHHLVHVFSRSLAVERPLQLLPRS
jgi:hypothetical protein